MAMPAMPNFDQAISQVESGSTGDGPNAPAMRIVGDAPLQMGIGESQPALTEASPAPNVRISSPPAIDYGQANTAPGRPEAQAMQPYNGPTDASGPAAQFTIVPQSLSSPGGDTQDPATASRQGTGFAPNAFPPTDPAANEQGYPLPAPAREQLGAAPSGYPAPNRPMDRSPVLNQDQYGNPLPTQPATYNQPYPTNPQGSNTPFSPASSRQRLETLPPPNNELIVPSAARPMDPSQSMAIPGERRLDGPQNAAIVINKRAPEEVKVGRPASFVTTVKNVGVVKAIGVRVFDRVPTGTQLKDATPPPNPKFQPELYWELGDLEPGEERVITLQLVPLQEGELGSVATASYQASASVRTISTRPELKVVQRAPEKVLIGQQVEIELEVSNPGTGEATGVLLQEDVPEGLLHPQGKQLDSVIGTLGPGQIRRQILRMKAVKPGLIENVIRVRGDDGLETTHTVALEVVAPDLQVALSGPSRRYLERQATYAVNVGNVGTADATNLELSVQLDRGFTFVQTNNQGQYDPSRHAVFWSLQSLPAGTDASVDLTLLPVEEGNRVLRTDASADLGISTFVENQVRVDSLAELTFSISDTADPIEIGGQTIYEIRVSNSGSRDDTNVQVALQLPQGLQLIEEGDFTPKGQGIIAFPPRALLKANDEMVFRVKAQGISPGRHLVKAVVQSDQSDVPVTKEESIMVYADR
ncbi:MAG: hypothetical protein AAGJ83_03955, partial [Planctomycetota bacterium]